MDHGWGIRVAQVASDTEVLKNFAEDRPTLDAAPAVGAGGLSIGVPAVLDDPIRGAIWPGNLGDGPHDVLDRGVGEVTAACVNAVRKALPVALFHRRSHR